MLLFIAAIAPSIALLYYFYMRDKYEKEPRRLLIKAFASGVIIIIPVLFTEIHLNVFDIADKNLIAVGYTAFVVAGLVEEAFKYGVFLLYIWKDREFNEMYDAIVYSVFISLGFATVENIAYVLSSGISTAVIRSLTAVPAHALFAVSMGYYLGIAKFASSVHRRKYMQLGFIVPVLLHGIYDFILFSQRIYLLILFIPYMLYLWRRGLRNADELADASPYRDKDRKNH
ncbi:MAG: PrsW family glutamic-type intramembrane protease [Bacillota bacterium]